MSNPNTRTKAEAWLEGLGVELLEVTLWTPEGPATERHVDDRSVLETTITMSLERLGGRFATFEDPVVGGWAIFDRAHRKLRHYPTKEAAEMVAIHHGQN